MFIIEYRSSLYKGGKARHVFNKAEKGVMPVKSNVPFPTAMSNGEAEFFQAMEKFHIFEALAAGGQNRIKYKIKKD